MGLCVGSVREDGFGGERERERGERGREIWGVGEAMGDGEKKKERRNGFGCVVGFMVLFAKCLCGTPRLEGVKPWFYTPSLLNLISREIDKKMEVA